ncbi:hypothetical protein GHT06_003871 [Daphnia sinensis]|uniref:CCHC-type domain-containing protein n=1 Tax=Daphnia sinensis TaxID=1820382 RepID=A0AAD5KT00_9CRUS|nr:hypothetical protein GHT06_003871 [Daphnia sinensis]
MSDRVYILALRDNCYYVGKSANVPKRLRDHRDGRGAEWTCVHQPLDTQPVMAVKPVQSGLHENEETLRMMRQHGVDRVRGGSWAMVALSDEDRRDVVRHGATLFDLCARCGRNGHFAVGCDATCYDTWVGGGVIPDTPRKRPGAHSTPSPSKRVRGLSAVLAAAARAIWDAGSSDSESEVECFACGEPGHIAPRCPRSGKCFNCGRRGHIAADCWFG